MVNSVTFLASVGGDNSTVTDDANPTTGLANDGHRLRFVPALSQLVAVAAFVVAQALAAAASATTAINAPGTSAVTTTASVTVGTGAKTFAGIPAGKLFAIGQWVLAARTSAPTTTYVIGQVTTFSGGTSITITVPAGGTLGSGGPFADWTISLTTPFDATLNGRVTTLENEAARLKARRRLLYKELA